MCKCYNEALERAKNDGRDIEKILSGEGEDKLVYVCDCDDDNKSECAYGEARSCCDCAWCCADASDCDEDKREGCEYDDIGSVCECRWCCADADASRCRGGDSDNE